MFGCSSWSPELSAGRDPSVVTTVDAVRRLALLLSNQTRHEDRLRVHDLTRPAVGLLDLPPLEVVAEQLQAGIGVDLAVDVADRLVELVRQSARASAA